MATASLALRRGILTALACSERSLPKSYICHCTRPNVQKSRGLVIGRYLSSKSLKKSRALELKEHEVYLEGDVTVKKLARTLNISTGSIMHVLEDLGEDITAGVNSTVHVGVADFILSEHGFKAVFPDTSDLEEPDTGLEDIDDSKLVNRAPVVTIMGHVDHGKTTLLDLVRKTSVAQGEAGGITQHIGAFSVRVPSGKKITFIDTPGHAAFVTMRARGVMATDIVVLVVAADDGVQGQTAECIQHAKDAKVPIIVAINKIDKAPHRVKQVKEELLMHGVQVEEYGGNVPCVEISALKGENLDQLEETIILVADMANLKAATSCVVRGIILESQTSKERGQVATVLVQQGTLKKGSWIIAGSAIAKVRQLLNDRGQPVVEAFPSDPVQVLGWRALPKLGDTVAGAESEAKAKSISSARALRAYLDQSKEQELQESGHFLYSKEDRPSQRGIKKSHTPFRVLRRRFAASQQKDQIEKGKEKLEIILKADVNGSLEALLSTIGSFENDNLTLSVLHSGVGTVGDSDLHLAQSTQALVYGFNIKPHKGLEKVAAQTGVQIRSYNVIYELLNDLKREVESRLPPIKEEDHLGEARVLEVFHLTGGKKATVAGCRVKAGTISLGSNTVIRVIRNKEVVHEGLIQMLKHGKEDIQVVNEGKECGISLKDYTEFMEGDFIECIRVNYRKQTVTWKSPGNKQS